MMTQTKVIDMLMMYEIKKKSIPIFIWSYRSTRERKNSKKNAEIQVGGLWRAIATRKKSYIYSRTFARKFSNIDLFLKILPLKDDELVTLEIKKGGVTDFVLERTCPEEHLNLSKSGFVSEEGDSGCKFQNIAIRALKRNALCQI